MATFFFSFCKMCVGGNAERSVNIAKHCCEKQRRWPYDAPRGKLRIFIRWDAANEFIYAQLYLEYLKSRDEISLFEMQFV